ATLGCAHGAGQPVLDVVTKPVVLDELRHLGPPGATLGVPLRDRRLVLELPGPSRRVPAQLTRDRRRAPVHTTGDLSHAMALRLQQRDVLTLRERQVAA